ncbi:RsmB/NOP family class I SAM-dependent RNA methyltransferase [Curtobacterium sp. MCPF17_046]|uniref:RsmB/NOP family class I SAM-dependent RNA methyltransferase n=1 Tax=Curtobacterium sp. MCPF17_046 TaxID=2175663 RepID=UPI000D99FD24|nr:transcription antitermination factor NusB [Curtobacterium sp. MCPF17_046]PYY42310.1 rRNA small subunit methyltransferase B [Curtobacterium sp. MCPF17_046]
MSAGQARPRGRQGSGDEGRRSGGPGAGGRRTGGRPQTARQVSARRVAFDVLRAVQVDDAYANLLLPTRIRRAGLSARDAGFATELTYGTIRMIGRYDAVVALASGRRADLVEADVLDVMRLGVHQLLAMRTPTHAAVSATVELAREVGVARATGFVNAVMRKVAAKTPEEWDALVTAGLGGEALLATRWSHPVWVVSAFRDALAAERSRDELVALLAADNEAPRVQLAALPGVATAEDVEQATARATGDGDASGDGPPVGPADDDTTGDHAGGAAAAADADIAGGDTAPATAPVAPDLPVSPVGIRGVAGDPARVPGVAAGRLRVQDEGSQLAALALSRSSEVRPGERWLDLCAGPGGKAALLAAEAAQAGATLVANELVPARVGLVREALRDFRDTVTVVEGDGRRFGQDGSGVRFDRILLDAPCTGLGALRRRPEARWRKQPEDVAELAVLQEELLEAAVRVLAPGGTLAYVTCSPHLAETRGQVDALMRRHGHELEQLDTASVVRSVAARDPRVADGRTVQLWPHRIGTDAMFIALVRRTA